MNSSVSATARPSSVSRVYYGWIVLVVAALAMVGTLPGRTQGLGLVTEPLLADLGLSRVDYATINLWATIIGAFGALGIGQLIDRAGSRAVLTFVALALGLVVAGMSQTASAGNLPIWITLTRAIGQSALSVISIAIVGHWFVRRIDGAMAAYSIILSVGFMAAFPAVGAAVQAWGWRPAWLAVGLSLIFVLAPLAWLVVRRSPEAIGLVPDGDAGNTPVRPDATALTGYHWRRAVVTPAFWVFAVGTSLYGLVSSGIGLFNESILAQRGFGPDVYYQTLVIAAMTGLAGNFAGGWMATRVPIATLMGASLFILAAGLVVLPVLAAMWQVIAWACLMGLGGGLVMVLFFSAWPRLYGRRHLGRIQGAAQALTVFASAVGPLLLAWCVDRTGSYALMFWIFAGVIALVGASAFVIPMPAPPDQSA
jgi:MFS family permease